MEHIIPDPVEKKIIVRDKEFTVNLNNPVNILQNWHVDRDRIRAFIDEELFQYIFEGYSLEKENFKFKKDADYTIEGLYDDKIISLKQKESLLDILEESRGSILTPRRVNMVWTHPALQVTTAHNGAVVKLPNNRYIMLFRSHLRDGRSIIGKGISHDGILWNIDPLPAMLPATLTDNFAESADKEEIIRAESGGIEDPRICQIPDDNSDESVYLITYSAYFDNENKVYPCLAVTRDFSAYTRMGPIIRSKARNTVIFPKLYKGNELYGLTRMSYGKEYQKITLIKTSGPWWRNRWEILRNVAVSSDGPGAMGKKIGPGATPILLDNGWFLSIEHGARQTVGGMNYVLRAAIYEENDPGKVNVSNIPILYPEEDIGYKGYHHVDKIVFTTSAIMENNGAIKIYIGSNDSVMKIAVTHTDVLKALIQRYPQSPETGTAMYDIYNRRNSK